MNIKIALLAGAGLVALAACGDDRSIMSDRGDAGATVAQAEPDPLGPNTPPAVGSTEQAPGATPAPGAAAQPGGLGAPVTAPQGAPLPGAQQRADADSLGQSPAVNAVQDALAGPVGQANASIVGGDTEGYLRNAALGDMYEIQAGQLALTRSKSPAVLAIARTVIDDHRAMTEALRDATLNGDVIFVPPAALDERREGLIDNLEVARADGFDEIFLDQQEAAHEEALNLHEAYADRGDVPELQVVARDAIPLIEAHLADVRAAQEAMEAANEAAAE